MPAPLGHEAYNKNGEGGAPVTKYTPEFIEAEACALEEWMTKKENVFIEDFCFERGYLSQRLREWCEKSERLASTYARFQERQKVVLFKGGLSKKFAYPMCALILSHSHGIIAKTEQKLSGDAVNPLAFILKNVDGTSKELINDKQE